MSYKSAAPLCIYGCCQGGEGCGLYKEGKGRISSLPKHPAMRVHRELGDEIKLILNCSTK